VRLVLEPYVAQCGLWPQSGRHILAQFDDSSVVVYQAFRAEIADEAARLGRFGPSFSRSRMSWIKPNFLWMMFRSGWATKEGQERVLAVRLHRTFFERVLVAAVPSSFSEEHHPSREAWAAAVKASEVRLQWDPDHDPRGAPEERRAIQLGLRGAMLAEYASDAIVEVEDVTEWVSAERARARQPFVDLQTPRERVYVPRDPRAALAVGASAWQPTEP
jgi:hypothetical protein